MLKRYQQFDIVIYRVNFPHGKVSGLGQAHVRQLDVTTLRQEQVLRFQVLLWELGKKPYMKIIMINRQRMHMYTIYIYIHVNTHSRLCICICSLFIEKPR